MKSGLNRRQFISLLSLIFLLLILPKTLELAQTVQHYLSEAVGVKANIIVDTQVVVGPMEKPWQALAQGGEGRENMLQSVINEVRALQPRYVRIDHLYDFYDVIGRDSGGKLTYNWQKLDPVIESILATGATPFLSLSYMPAAISSFGLVDPPVSWKEWAAVVKATIQHYSGRNEKNIAGIYYEVWNEPDLFGQWQIGKEPDYRTLYVYALSGAFQAQDCQPFKIGGPGITSPIKNWLIPFLDYVDQSNLRLDFISWHRYARRPAIFNNDLNNLHSWLQSRPRFAKTEKIISEWGSDPENHSSHDSAFDAAHLVAVARQLLDHVTLAFSFEIKDGLDPEGKEYWGRWGLLTHETFGKHQKPRYQAVKYLNQLGENRLSLIGEGTWVSGLATKDQETIKLLLVNYDPYSRHWENVPVTFAHLDRATYSYQEVFLLGSSKRSREEVTAGGLIKQISMPPNSIALIQLIKESP